MDIQPITTNNIVEQPIAEAILPPEVTLSSYKKYKLLSKISFGKSRKEYAKKRNLIKHLLDLDGRFPSCDLSGEPLKKLITSLKRHFFKTNWINCNGFEFLGTEAERKDFEAHLFTRLNIFRKTVVPWLDSVRPLKGASVLEIGCGTGSSTIALGKKGAKIAAVDVDEEAMEVAKERCHVYGINEIEFKLLNAAKIGEAFSNQFDHIIFFASMEHMTYEERIRSIQSAYKLLKKDGIVSVVETPNRLWFNDSHTSFAPFFHWLSDECAMDYAQYTRRKLFNSAFEKRTEESSIRLARWGRGMSFHEFVIALGGYENVKVVSSMQSFLDRKLYRKCAKKTLNFVRRILGKKDAQFKMFLKYAGPSGMHEGFYDEYLNIALRK